mmetsp:Transcript_12738/g.24544  ORF Transcript_12738/g.24544 Transcript_12738/m.24544 type:complete len:292 (-) Transcript_12738:3977-4852(-)
MQLQSLSPNLLPPSCSSSTQHLTPIEANSSELRSMQEWIRSSSSGNKLATTAWNLQNSSTSVDSAAKHVVCSQLVPKLAARSLTEVPAAACFSSVSSASLTSSKMGNRTPRNTSCQVERVNKAPCWCNTLKSAVRARDRTSSRWSPTMLDSPVNSRNHTLREEVGSLPSGGGDGEEEGEEEEEEEEEEPASPCAALLMLDGAEAATEVVVEVVVVVVVVVVAALAMVAVAEVVVVVVGVRLLPAVPRWVLHCRRNSTASREISVNLLAPKATRQLMHSSMVSVVSTTSWKY